MQPLEHSASEESSGMDWHCLRGLNDTTPWRRPFLKSAGFKAGVVRLHVALHRCPFSEGPGSSLCPEYFMWPDVVLRGFLVDGCGRKRTEADGCGRLMEVGNPQPFLGLATLGKKDCVLRVLLGFWCVRIVFKSVFVCFLTVGQTQTDRDGPQPFPERAGLLAPLANK